MFLIVFVIAALLLAACGTATNLKPRRLKNLLPPKRQQRKRTATDESAAADTGDMMPAEMVDGMIVLPEVDPLAVEGDVVTAGSSTVFPLAEAVAERFYDEGYGGTVTIDSIGSGAGFSRFCESGETDVSNASRPIKESES